MLGNEVEICVQSGITGTLGAFFLLHIWFIDGRNNVKAKDVIHTLRSSCLCQTFLLTASLGELLEVQDVRKKEVLYFLTDKWYCSI